MASQAEFSFQDYSKEISRVRFNITPVTAANYDAVTLAVNNLGTAILGVQADSSMQTKRIVAADVQISKAPATEKACQREIKWLCTLEDTTLHSLSRHEIPQADVNLVTANTDFMDLSTGAGATLKTDIEAVVKSPAGNSVVLLSVQLVGKRL